ncbi:flagellar basal body-associated protein FliL [Ferrimonas senticii]|uniref:flagellar basal body-associated protein FliL n=1 Tax=Ferrimonas senticii TaxID=394566 RepID=UPI000410E013|nr:flagellar basal body-associated protein FliL [Ferrimonas senticii]
MKQLGILLLLLASYSSAAAQPAEANSNIGYYGLEPEIVTNYITNTNNLGFIRVGVELMLHNADDMALVEQHQPLIRAHLIEILGQQPADLIKSLSGREEIRRRCFEQISQALQQETGKELLMNLLFTKYLYD